MKRPTIKTKVTPNKIAPPPMSEANKIFVSSLAKDDNGGNSILHDFMGTVVPRLTQLKDFSLNDAFMFSRPLDLPVDEVRKIFTAWSAKLTQLGKLRKLDSPVYGFEIFEMIW